MQLPPRLRPTEAATILEPLTVAAKTAKKKAATKKVTAVKVKKDAKTGLTLIDVRMPQEITSGTIPGARQIPLDNILQTVPSEIPDPAAPVVVYCKSGMRGGIHRRRF
ncbi:rhodanese-like domain-containing protein [bacterium]|nr:MAG: rhodanese-like domain-containing protein [bacterium]